MKRAFTSSTCHDEEDIYSSAEVTHDNAYNEESGSNNNDNDNDSECSDLKMRKKRNAYQKISDDIRVSLLDAVQNGETLKAAAKRYKINYSSAKSILHTYRKEGRILKKSAQERTTKKKSSITSENKQPASKIIKATKKETAQADENSYKQKPLESMTKKVKTESASSNNNTEEVLPLGQVDNNRNKDAAAHEDHQDSQVHAVRALPIIPTVNHHDHDGHGDMHFQSGMNSRGHSRRNSIHHPFKLFDNFQMNYSDMQFPEFNLPGDTHHDNFLSYRRLSRDFDSFNDMVTALHGKPGQHEEHLHDPNVFLGSKSHHAHGDEKHGKVENVLDYEDHGDGNNNCPLRSFMDTQRLFRNALRKASFLSFSSNTGYRKGSFDLF